jgi:hypothetical protein
VLEVAEGYAAWSATYDQRVNPMVGLEQPIVRSVIDAISAGRALEIVNKKCLYNRYYAAFRQAIQNVLRTVDRQHPSELRTLLTLRFQTFSQQEALLAV